MRLRSSLFLSILALSSGCSAVADFGFTFSDAGADAASDGGGVDMMRPDGAADMSFDGGVACTTTCDDGNPCNGVETCDTTMGACVSGTPVSCPAPDACHVDGTCDTATGACVAGPSVNVDDGDPCDGVETCVLSAGMMTVTHSGPRCDDGVGCTSDTCDPTTGACTSVPTDSSCTGATEICRATAASCTTTTCSTTTDCSGGQICYGGFCCAAATGGCMVVACTTDANCDDHMACNGVERCDPTTNTCGSGTPPDCGDGLACSIDSCVEGVAGAFTCRHIPPDGDGDTYRDSRCISGMGNDCNDSDPTIHPGATELCDGIDQNCDGTADETFANLGNACSAGVGACLSGGTFVCAASRTATVCNAMAGMAGTNELCGNAIDDNCNGMTDEGFSMLGAGCTVGVGACMHMGSLVCSTDQLSLVCNTGPGSPGNELCGNGIDDNCNGMVDEGFPGLGMNCTVGMGACLAMGTRVCSGDRLSVVCSAMAGTPTAEVCNGIDDDCNGVVDNGVTVTYWRDADGDGYGTGAAMNGCIPPSGYATRSGDCNDADNSVNPGVAEVCGNSIDDNCNAMIDEFCPPANDLCANATSLGTVRPNMTGMLSQGFDYATTQTSDCMNMSGMRGTGPEVYFSFSTPPSSYPFVVYFDTLGSSFNTMISLRDSCTLPPSLCADDACGNPQTQLVAVIPASAAARTYILAVHAFPATVPLGSSIMLHWQAIPGASGTIMPLPAVGSTTVVTMPGDPGALASSSCSPTTNTETSMHGEDLFFMVSCPGVTHALHADTCMSTAYNSVMYVRGAMSGGDVLCNDDGGGTCGMLSSVTATIVGAGLYGLWVDRANMISPPLPPSSYRLFVSSF